MTSVLMVTWTKSWSLGVNRRWCVDPPSPNLVVFSMKLELICKYAKGQTTVHSKDCAGRRTLMTDTQARL